MTNFLATNHTTTGSYIVAVTEEGSAAKSHFFAEQPACDLVIAWTYLSARARNIFVSEIELDEDTWLRSRAWVLWKATFELCNIADKSSLEALFQKKIIDEVINE